MRIYVASTPNEKPKAFTGLKDACKFLGVSAASAYKGKRAWIKDKAIKSIEEMELVTIKRKRK